MGPLKKILLFTCMCFFAFCKHKPGNSAEKQKPVDIREFIGVFPATKLPANFGDSSLVRKSRDSAISTAVLRQFVPDSLFRRYWGKNPKTRFYGSGKVAVKKAETYLFLKSVDGTRKGLYILAFDREDHFKAMLTLVFREDDADVQYVSSMDNKYTVTVNRQFKDARGPKFFKKSVYIFNGEGAFTLIMTESNEQKAGLAQIFNPIDSLSRKHKYTGDYIQDKRNFISVRDGRTSTVVRFFVHFEKEKGTCIGELKGEARFVSPTVARYSSNGDPCSIQFTFSDKNIRMKELEGCGNHRGIRCYFEGVYDKHKPGKEKPVKQKPKHKP
ncbi:MAG: hypothetical protein Q8926_11785 [Bacteroidota bacterium]|nr:hypothetical protein [Bacteroidota bacterium]